MDVVVEDGDSDAVQQMAAQGHIEKIGKPLKLSRSLQSMSIEI